MKVRIRPKVIAGKLTVGELARARVLQCGVRKQTLAKFRDKELLGIAWFAQVPDIFAPDATPKLCEWDVLFNKFNSLCLAFWDAYRRLPDETLKVVAKVRETMHADEEDIVLRMILGPMRVADAREIGPVDTDPQRAKAMTALFGTNPVDPQRVKKARQRLTKAAKKSGTN